EESLAFGRDLAAGERQAVEKAALDEYGRLAGVQVFRLVVPKRAAPEPDHALLLVVNREHNAVPKDIIVVAGLAGIHQSGHLRDSQIVFLGLEESGEVVPSLRRITDLELLD